MSDETSQQPFDSYFEIPLTWVELSNFNVATSNYLFKIPFFDGVLRLQFCNYCTMKLHLKVTVRY